MSKQRSNDVLEVLQRDTTEEQSIGPASDGVGGGRGIKAGLFRCNTNFIAYAAQDWPNVLVCEPASHIRPIWAVSQHSPGRSVTAKNDVN